jgi:hypothetical protein
MLNPMRFSRPFSRRLTCTLLWLAVALLPLRGLAAVLMPMQMSMQMGTQGTVQETVQVAAPAMPCHSVASTDLEAAADTGSSSHTCSMCDLCHSNLAQPSLSWTLPPAPHQAQPKCAAPPDLGPGTPEGLYRPPRSTLH